MAKKKNQETENQSQNQIESPEVIKSEKKPNVRNRGLSHQYVTARRKVELLKALEENRGIVTYAARAAHADPGTFYKYAREDPEFKAAMDQIQETVCDFVEKKLYDNIEHGDSKSIMFYLRCKGVKRGFVEHSEQTLNVNDINIDLNLD